MDEDVIVDTGLSGDVREPILSLVLVHESAGVGRFGELDT